VTFVLPNTWGSVICFLMMSLIAQRRVARALRAGGPEVIEVAVEELSPLKSGEVLVRVEAAGLNHAETLIRSGNYTVRLPFPHAVGGEGSGTVVATGSGVTMSVGTRVCWGAVLGSCATFVTAPASMLVPIPDGLSFEDGACLAVAGLTAGGLARVWPLKGRRAVVWGAAGAVGRMLVATLADQGIDIIGIASGKRVDAVRAAGANHVIDRTTEDVRDAVRAYTGGCVVAAVFDPIGALTYETSLQLLAPRGCLISYGELSGPRARHQPAPALSGVRLRHQVQRYALGRRIPRVRWSHFGCIGLGRATPRCNQRHRWPVPARHVADAYRVLESGSHGKVLVLPMSGPCL
jgi:NADPH:quinone reductase